MRYLISGLIALILIGCASTPEGRDSSVVQQNRAALQRTIQQTVSGRFWHRNLAGLNARSLVAQFYQRRHYQPAWVLLSHQQPRQRALLRILQAADQEGLNPSDYHVATLATEISLPKPWKRILSPEEIQQLVRRELAWTDAYLAYAHHVSLGQLYPTGRKLYWQRHPSRNALLSQLLPALHSGKTLTKTLRGLIPRQAGYLRLRKALQEYRALAARAPEWSWIPGKNKLVPGESDARVPQIRERLWVTGDLKQKGDSTVFCGRLEGAIRRFQQRHGLEVDGTIGRATLAALNVSPTERIRQIRINMERLRWLSHETDHEYILVNIPDYRLDYVNRNRHLISMNVVVGKRTWETPVLSSDITHLVLNPKWNVPSGIFEKEVLGEIKKDPNYLKKKGMKVLQGGGGRQKVVSADSIDWTKVNPKRPNLRIVQSSGPGNSLGRVKFIFSNPFSIYLHDTPSKRLFKRPKRALSHGCVRVAEPMQLANALFRENSDWNRGQLQKAINSGKNQAVRLGRPVRVHVLYWTAWVDEDGTVHFRNDIYGRDRSLQRALNI